jgi:hypothetical protein
MKPERDDDADAPAQRLVRPLLIEKALSVVFSLPSEVNAIHRRSAIILVLARYAEKEDIAELSLAVDTRLKAFRELSRQRSLQAWIRARSKFVASELVNLIALAPLQREGSEYRFEETFFLSALMARVPPVGNA